MNLTSQHFTKKIAGELRARTMVTYEELNDILFKGTIISFEQEITLRLKEHVKFSHDRQKETCTLIWILFFRPNLSLLIERIHNFLLGVSAATVL